MNKQPEVTEQTRANLRQAFWELYGTKPVEKITIREITDRAGYNRATFYLYYRDVYDLLTQIEDEILGEVRHLVDHGLLQEEKLDLTHHMGRIVELTQRYETYMPKLIGGTYGDPAFAEQLKNILAPLLDRFILPPAGLSNEQRHVLREFYLSGLLAAIAAWVSNPQRMPIDQLIALIVTAALGERR